MPLALGGAILLAVICLGILAPLLAPRSPYERNELIRIGNTLLTAPLPPMPGFPLGSDGLGRDLLSRLLYGARYTLLLGLLVLTLRLLIAVPWGLVAAWRAGGSEWLLRRAMILFGALPGIVIPAIFVLRLETLHVNGWLQILFGALAVAVAGVPRLAESVRLHALEVLAQPFVDGARAVGAGTARLLGRYLLPHLGQRLAVAAALELAWTFLLLAQLGLFQYFTGGVILHRTVMGGGPFWPRLPEWTAMIDPPQNWLMALRWQPMLPLLGIFLLIAGCNLVAEGLRRLWQGQDQLSLGD